MTINRLMVLATLLAASGSSVIAMRTRQEGITRTDLQRHDLSATGREVIQVRVAFAPGASFGRHTHPGEEVIYMLEGVLEYEVQGRSRLRLEAGQVLFIPAGAVHAARNPGRSRGVELATYVVEKGMPALSMVR